MTASKEKTSPEEEEPFHQTPDDEIKATTALTMEAETESSSTGPDGLDVSSSRIPAINTGLDEDAKTKDRLRYGRRRSLNHGPANNMEKTPLEPPQMERLSPARRTSLSHTPKDEKTAKSTGPGLRGRNAAESMEKTPLAPPQGQRLSPMRRSSVGKGTESTTSPGPGLRGKRLSPTRRASFSKGADDGSSSGPGLRGKNSAVIMEKTPLGPTQPSQRCSDVSHALRGRPGSVNEETRAKSDGTTIRGLRGNKRPAILNEQVRAKSEVTNGSTNSGGTLTKPKKRGLRNTNLQREQNEATTNAVVSMVEQDMIDKGQQRRSNPQRRSSLSPAAGARTKGLRGNHRGSLTEGTINTVVSMVEQDLIDKGQGGGTVAAKGLRANRRGSSSSVPVFSQPGAYRQAGIIPNPAAEEPEIELSEEEIRVQGAEGDTSEEDIDVPGTEEEEEIHISGTGNDEDRHIPASVPSTQQQQQQQGTEDNSGLVEANLVPSSRHLQVKDLEVALHVPEEFERKSETVQKQRKRTRRQLRALVGCGVVLVALVLVTSIYVATRAENSNDAAQQYYSETATSAPPSTMAPTTEPFLALLPPRTQSIIQEGLASNSSVVRERIPQLRAYQWVLEDPGFGNYTEHRLLQRFAMATFYYASNGDGWIQNGGVTLELTPGPGVGGPSQGGGGGGRPGGSGGGQGGGGRPQGGGGGGQQGGNRRLQGSGGGGGGGQQGGGGRPQGGNGGGGGGGGQQGGGGRPQGGNGGGGGGGGQQGGGGRPQDGNGGGGGGRPQGGSGGRPPPPPKDGPPREYCHRGACNVTFGKWLDYDTHECTWYATTPICVNETVQALNLISNGVSGSLPEELGLLTSLRLLGFHTNRIKGRIPTSIGLMKNLTELRLNSNGFDGTIPTEIEHLTNLQAVALTANKLSGSFPSQLLQFPNMTQIKLQENQFTGTIPDDIGNMLPKLEEFYVGMTSVGGTLPASLGNCSSLYFFDARKARFTGPIPTEVGLLSNSLAFFGVEENQLTGTVPSELGKLRRLNNLDLKDNVGLTGTVPIELEDLNRNLGKLTLVGTSLSGTIPSVLCQVRDLSFDCPSLCGCSPCECLSYNNVSSPAYNNSS